MTSSTLLAGAISGLLLGGLYAVTALGLSMVFGVMRLVNIVHGELLILAAYLDFTISGALGIDPLLTALLLIPVMFLIGYPIQRWLLNPLMHQGMEPPLLVTFGLSIIAQNLMLLIWKADSRAITTGYSDVGLQLFGVRVPLLYLVAFVLAFVLIGGIQFLLSHSYIGKAIRAASQDARTAQVMGINPEAVYALTYAIGAATAALGGTLIGMSFSFVPTSGLTWLLKGFVVVVLGGMGSIVGMLGGGLILGVAEGVGAAITGTGYRDMIGLLIFLAVLVIRPRGLFGRSRE
ncbi:MAG TPA: branched-chain amino acid ABC transporter permease [Ktedonobacteraceae bacterium]|jgi:branched-chain amino acid transport system permease protein|nr:branched-chain amino acid ABC transporter permease [Ktedonobacteraceae bacterium]